MTTPLKSILLPGMAVLLAGLLVFCGCRSIDKTKIGFLIAHEQEMNRELQAAFDFLADKKSVNAEKITFENIKHSPELLKQYDILWFHYTDSTAFPGSVANEKTVQALKNYVEKGGRLLLTQDAVRYIADLELERKPPEIRKVEVKDYGYGKKLGFHAFLSHPVFNGLFGGAVIFNPENDTVIRQTGYFGEHDTLNAKVVGIDWSYITFKETSKLVLEYRIGKGNVLAVGSYLLFSIENRNRKEFDIFTNNLFDYLKTLPEKGLNYWKYNEDNVKPFESSFEQLSPKQPEKWKDLPSIISFSEEPATKNPWDLAGQRMLVMGKENAGIEEIWAHPFMALRDYETGIQFEGEDKVNWFSALTPLITITPDKILRNYHINGTTIKETISVSMDKPVTVVHYDFSGDRKLKLYIRFKSNLRMMWPYSSKVLGNLFYAWDDNIRSFVIKDESGRFVTFVGTNAKPGIHLIGQYKTLHASPSGIETKPTELLQTAALMNAEINQNGSIDVLIAASDEGMKKTLDYYHKAMKNPFDIYLSANEYYAGLLNGKLVINTPDRELNEGYRWALIGTDRFFVHTPGLGRSLVAGYATTAKGWDGGQKISGRPGYAWYFGRDGQWSGMAVNDYGDFEKVKDILKMYIYFQNPEGKVYHELTTSGAVHYDAADATPLFIILAGKYLRASGDKKFIKENWKSIRQAIDFCYSTDTDGDHLIENPNVGHGWVEGGFLFGGKTTLYLASCWAEALDQAAYMAEALGNDGETEKYRNESHLVTRIINDNFWDKENNYLNHSVKTDGSYIHEKTIMPAVPLYFGQIDREHASAVLEQMATNQFTTNWGVRMVEERNQHFNPRGYHTGSVWPLYTGWTALAEYRNRRPMQGYSHTMNNVLVYKVWQKGFIEEVLNGESYLPSGVCSHQCWSETMALQPLLEGMLGYEPDALNNKLSLSPALPADWDWFEAENIPLGKQKIKLTMKRIPGKLVYRFETVEENPVQVEFSPVLPAKTKISRVLLDSREQEAGVDQTNDASIIHCNFILKKDATLEFLYEGGVAVLPIVQYPVPGDKAPGLRIISSGMKDGKYVVTLEAPVNSIEFVNLYVNENNFSIDGGEVTGQQRNIIRVKVDFKGGNEKYVSRNIQVTFE